jgi:hypothetical protein
MLQREFESARLKKAPTEKLNGVITARSATELLERADDTRLRVGDLIARALQTETEDGSGSNGTNGPGNNPGPVTTEPPPDDPQSFDQFPPEVQEQSTNVYIVFVEPPARDAAAGGVAIVDACIDQVGSTPSDDLDRRAKSALDEANSVIASIVAGAAVTFGGPVGMGVAALFIAKGKEIVFFLEQEFKDLERLLFGA